MIKWTSIGGFHNVCKTLELYPHLHVGDITYRAKIKLHGMNAGIVIHPDGRLEAQSREVILTPKEDMKNFCKQGMMARDDFWEGLRDRDEVITVFGEWCGMGIEKGTAINKIAEKIFAVFAIQLGESETDEFGYDHGLTVIDPVIIKRILNGAGQIPSNVAIVPWYGDDITVDYANTPSKASAADIMNDVVKRVEACDPWVKDKFGVDGIGEGVVYYPISLSNLGSVDRHEMRTFSFKAKGKEHKVMKTKEAVQIEPEVAASIDDFVTMVVTSARLEQGARAVANGELEFSQRNIGGFLKWMRQDIQKETADELAASELTWDQVDRPISTTAKTWYLNELL